LDPLIKSQVSKGESRRLRRLLSSDEASVPIGSGDAPNALPHKALVNGER
jgi:hypothetical protein